MVKEIVLVYCNKMKEKKKKKKKGKKGTKKRPE